MNEEKKRRSVRWHSVDPGEAVRLLGTNASRGLSHRDAAKRRRSLGTNQLWQIQKTSVLPVLFGEFLDYAAILLVITAAVAALFERSGEAVLIGALLVISALLRGGTALMARRIFETSARENIPRARIIREGEFRSVFADEVVPGDILILTPGDTVVCDARLITGELQVLETPLTESRVPVKKSALHILEPQVPCECRSNMVFASSVVVTGTARAAAVVTGERTYAFVREGYIPVRTEQKAEILEKLAGWCRSVSLVMIGAVLLITLGGFLWGRSEATIDSLFLSALALAVASMSEFLCAVANIIFASSMQMLQRASEKRALVKNADAVESFSRAGCLILSTEQMLLGDHYCVDRWYADGEWKNAPAEGEGSDQLLSLLHMAGICCGGSGASLAAADAEIGAEETLRVLCRKLTEKYGAGKMPAGIPSATAFSKNGELYTALISSEDGMQAYVCGELRFVLDCCSQQAGKGETHTITAAERQALLSEAQAYERRCVRTVAVAVRLSPYDNLAKATALHNKMTLIGFFTVVNPVELSLVRYVSSCRESGTRIAVLTQSPARGRYLAAEAGILTEKDRYIDLAGDGDALRAWLEEDADGCAVIHTPVGTDRAALVKTVREYIPEVIYAGTEQRDLSACAEASASVAAQIPEKSCPCCLCRRADALAGREAETQTASAASALETLRIIGYCRGSFSNLRGAAEYLLLSQTLRLCLTLAAVLLGYPLLSPVLLLVWGLLLDYAAVMMLAFRTPRMADLRLSGTSADLPSIGNGFLFPVAAGVLTAVLLAAVPAAGSAIGLEVTPRENVFLLYIGSILVTAVAAVQNLSEKAVGIRINAAEIVYALLLIAVGAAVWLHEGLLWSETLGWCMLFGLVPAILVGVLYRVYKQYRNPRDGVE